MFVAIVFMSFKDILVTKVTAEVAWLSCAMRDYSLQFNVVEMMSINRWLV